MSETQATDRVRFLVMLGPKERRQLEKVRKEFGLINSSEAFRFCVRSLDKRRRKGEAIDELDEADTPDGRTPFHIWLTPAERETLARLRRARDLEHDSEAVRLAIQTEFNDL